MARSRRRAAAVVALIVRTPAFPCQEQLPSRQLDLHAENWEEVLEQNEFTLIHFWAPYDSPSAKLDEVHEIVAATQAADLSDQTQIVHARSDVTDERGYTPFLIEYGVNRLPALVLFRQRTLPLGITADCASLGDACMRLGAGCSCASVFPTEGRPSNHVPKPLGVLAWLKAQTDLHAGNAVGKSRATRARQLRLYHDGRYSQTPNTEQILNRDLHENADDAGSWGTGWLEVGGGDYVAPMPNADDVALARSGTQCAPGPDGRCHGCTLHTVAPSGWDNPDTSLGYTGCETCGDQGS